MIDLVGRLGLYWFEEGFLVEFVSIGQQVVETETVSVVVALLAILQLASLDLASLKHGYITT